MIILLKLKAIYPDKHVFLNYVTSPMINGEIRCTLEVSGIIFAEFRNDDQLIKFVNNLWKQKFRDLRNTSMDDNLIVGPLYVKHITGNPKD